jgi:hypothetical protein
LWLFGFAGGQIGTGRIDDNGLLGGIDHDIHVLHGDSAQQHFIPQYQGTDKALAILEVEYADSCRAMASMR